MVWDLGQHKTTISMIAKTKNQNCLAQLVCAFQNPTKMVTDGVDIVIAYVSFWFLFEKKKE